MRINRITIKNFRSYYGENIFDVSDGLTLIIGGNGDGKTTFFEALEWLFYTNPDERRDVNISAKRAAELKEGEEDEVSVSIVFEHDGKKELVKSFGFRKGEDEGISTFNHNYIGYVDAGSERRREDGAKLLERCFDTVIRKYCLFKGENELNVFNDSTALSTLVDTFSDIKLFDDFVDTAESLEKTSGRAVEKELANDRKCERRARELSSEKDAVERKIGDLKDEIKSKTVALSGYEERLRKLEQNQETTEKYQEIKERINNLSDKRATAKVHTDVDFNANLLDDSWILRAFPSILQEYQTKVSELNLRKRELKEADIEKKAKEKGKQELIEKLANGATPLPWNIPDKETMQEMLNAGVCKVCGTEAPKGSAPYKFMEKRFKAYLKEIEKQSKKTQPEEEKPLFPNMFIEELHTRLIKMSGADEKRIANIATDIDERLEFIAKRKADLEKIERALEEAEEEKRRLLLQARGLSPELLEKSFSDLKGFFDAKSKTQIRLQELNQELKEQEAEKARIDEEFAKLSPDNATGKIYQRVHTALDEIMKAFQAAKDKNVDDFLASLQTSANKYLRKLNENDFSGIIEIRKTIDNSARIQLCSKDGSQVYAPSGSQETTMYMSVLFAISEITTLKRDQDYPLIFDAPTSSFGGFKENSFYNVIDKIDKQCIIVTKDLLIEDKRTGEAKLDNEQIDRLSCSVYRISKDKGYDSTDLSTIATKTKKIK